MLKSWSNALSATRWSSRLPTELGHNFNVVWAVPSEITNFPGSTIVVSMYIFYINGGNSIVISLPGSAVHKDHVT